MDFVTILPAGRRMSVLRREAGYECEGIGGQRAKLLRRMANGLYPRRADDESCAVAGGEGLRLVINQRGISENGYIWGMSIGECRFQLVAKCNGIEDLQNGRALLTELRRGETRSDYHGEDKAYIYVTNWMVLWRDESVSRLAILQDKIVQYLGQEWRLPTKEEAGAILQKASDNLNQPWGIALNTDVPDKILATDGQQFVCVKLKYRTEVKQDTIFGLQTRLVSEGIIYEGRAPWRADKILTQEARIVLVKTISPPAPE